MYGKGIEGLKEYIKAEKKEPIDMRELEELINRQADEALASYKELKKEKRKLLLENSLHGKRPKDYISMLGYGLICASIAGLLTLGSCGSNSSDIKDGLYRTGAYIEEQIMDAYHKLYK